MISGKRLLSASLLFGLLCSAMPARSAEWGLAQLMSGFAGVQESRARFKEEKHLAILTEPLKLSGTLRYERPDRIEKLITQPYTESMRIKGDQLEWESQGKMRTLSLRSQPQIWALAESLRATLAGDLPSLQQHYKIKLNGTARKWNMTLEPRYPALWEFIEEIRLQGSDNQLREVDILETNGNRSLMQIEEIKN